MFEEDKSDLGRSQNTSQALYTVTFVSDDN